MYQIEWARPDLWKQERNCEPSQDSKLDWRAVRRTLLLQWEDHCLECAVPLCFSSCSLYAPRLDGMCARFIYGIYPNRAFRGLFDYGADIRFRRWGKLEAIVHGKSERTWLHRSVDTLNRMLCRALPAATLDKHQALGGRGPQKFLEAFWKTNLAKVRGKYFAWFAPALESVAYDEFVLECYSAEQEAFRLKFEYYVGNMTWDHTFVGSLKYRHSFNISPGRNFYTLSPGIFSFGEGRRAGRIMLYPENNAEPRLIFTWLDLVQYRDGVVPSAAKAADSPQAIEVVPSGAKDASVSPPKPGRLVPAAKVKCVIWDLDNTLWSGILVEEAEGNLHARPEALELIKKLDERGIIQSVISKNNYADAWPVIEKLGLQGYFLYPAINWQPKSANLKQVAGRLNLNPDAFAVIDDSPFERAEIQTALPQVRVYSEDQIGALLSYDEFDVPISESTRKRRASYLTEIRRETERESFGGDYEAFLRSCEMKLRLFVPSEDEHVARCLELIQRSNQLNLSGARYKAEEFQGLLGREGFLCVAMDCRDRFGEYGIVGFASIDETQPQPTLRDLVLSCRVAQKRVEHTFIQWLAQREQAQGCAMLRAELVRTERNQPIRQVFQDLHFRLAGENGDHVMMELPLDQAVTVGDIVRLEVAVGINLGMAASSLGGSKNEIQAV
jgi:FkbH-like protein